MEKELSFHSCKPKFLNNWVEYFVLFKGNGMFQVNVSAQPFAYILFNFNHSLEFISQNQKLNTKKSFIEPVALSPIKFNIKLDSESEILGAKIKPSFLYFITGIPLHLFSGNIIEISEIFNTDVNELLEKINSVNFLTEKALIAEQYFLKKMKLSEEKQVSDNINAVKYLAANYFSTNSIDDLLNTFNVSHRTLERHFTKYTGVSPKTMLSLVRFQKILEYVTVNKSLNLDKLWDFGYYDYAHFSRDFKKYSGQTFENFKQELKNVENLQVKSEKPVVFLPHISIYEFFNTERKNMKVFRVFLVAVFAMELVYTIIAGNNHGWNLFSIFFNDITAMNWAGQFDLDFMCFLMITGLWVAWRNHFSTKGILLGIIATVGGILFLAPYLFIVSFEVNGNMKELLLGKKRANQ